MTLSLPLQVNIIQFGDGVKPQQCRQSKGISYVERNPLTSLSLLSRKTFRFLLRNPVHMGLMVKGYLDETGGEEFFVCSLFLFRYNPCPLTPYTHKCFFVYYRLCPLSTLTFSFYLIPRSVLCHSISIFSLVVISRNVNFYVTRKFYIIPSIMFCYSFPYIYIYILLVCLLNV